MSAITARSLFKVAPATLRTVQALLMQQGALVSFHTF